MIFDTHAHLNFPDYEDDRDDIIKKTLKEGVFMINVGTDFKESEKVIEIAKKYKRGVYASIGLHPLHIKDEVFSFEKYKKMAEDNKEKVVAIGETGLDKHGDNLEEQKKVFLEHIKLAEELQLPLIIHCRKEHNEVISILANYYPVILSDSEESLEHPQDCRNDGGVSKFHPKGVIHCFTGNITQAREYIDMGFYLGFNGIIFKINLKKIIKKVPLEKILLETDCPFLTPPDMGTERNEPIFTKEVAKEIAKIKEISVGEVIKVTTDNALKLFKVYKTTYPSF
ncbi:MAG: TatD family hydrolase [Patescibacteria group bacterium]|nr:TatD family hydrolase [Patescibacteria group bacterium]